jgi:hypothetical protein
MRFSTLPGLLAICHLLPLGASALITVGALDTPGVVSGVAVVGDLAYLADGSSGLRVIDVSDPASPVELGSLDTPGYAYGVEVVGDLAYVADSGSGLRVIDVSHPASPVELGSIDTPNYANDVEVVGDLAYVGADACLDGCVSGSLRIIDVSNLAIPVEIGSVDTLRLPIDVEVVGDSVYVADLGDSDGSFDFGMRVIDVSTPTFPVEIGAVKPPESAYGVEVVGDLAYVADGESGLRIIDLGPEYFAGQCGGPGFVQLNPTSSLVPDAVCVDSLKTYWFSAVAGESYAVRVATVTGDPDLYGSTDQACIESLPTPGGGCSYESSTTPGAAVEEIQFTAAATGPYYIGVHGVTDGTYQIEVPEPTGLLLLGAGLATLLGLSRMRRR